MYTVCQKCGKKLTDPESMRRGYGPNAGHRLAEFLRLILADQGAKPTFPDK